jgi:hypothetical protein
MPHLTTWGGGNTLPIKSNLSEKGMKRYSFEEKVKRLEEWKSRGSTRRLSSGGQRREKSGGDIETSLDSEKNILKISLSETRRGCIVKTT